MALDLLRERPLCILAGWMLLRRFHETIERRRHRLDYAGAALLAVGISAVILGLLEGGQAWAWNAPQSYAAFALGLVALLAFVLVESKAAEPILPLWVFSRRLLITTTGLSLLVGAMVIGLTSYVPTYLEGALKVSPLVSGLALAALTLGWPVSASLSGRIYTRIGFRPTVLIGVALALVGTLGLALTAAAPSVLTVAATCFVVGAGFGLIASPGIIAAQSSVPWNERGVVTGTNLFARSIGSAVGVAIFGAIANSILGQAAAGGPDAPGAGSAPTEPPGIVAAGGAVFLAVAVCAVLLIAAAALMPRTRVEDVQRHAPAEGAEG